MFDAEEIADIILDNPSYFDERWTVEQMEKIVDLLPESHPATVTAELDFIQSSATQEELEEFALDVLSLPPYGRHLKNIEPPVYEEIFWTQIAKLILGRES